MEPRTHGAIALGPTGNMQGTVKFLCCDTFRVLKRRAFTKFNMPDSIIKKINKYGLKTRRAVYGANLEFKNRNKEPYEWDYEDDINGMMQHQAKPKAHPEIPAEFPGVRLESDMDIPCEAVEEELVDDHALAAAAAANAGIHQELLGDSPAGASAGDLVDATYAPPL